MFGVLLGAPTLRLRGDYLAIVTLGFGEIIRIFLVNLNAPVNITNGPQGINLIDPIRLGGFSLAQTHTALGLAFPAVYNYYYLFLALTLAVVFVSMRLENSRIGRAWVAIREDEVAAAAMGINTRNVKLLAFAMGASFGGVSGGLFAGFQGFVSPESFTLIESIMILCMVVLGGMGHIAGVVLGAVLLVVLPEALRYLGPLQQALFGKVLRRPGGPAAARVRAGADTGDAAAALGAVAVHDAPARAVRRAGRRGRNGRRMTRAAAARRPAQPLLEAVAISKRFGGLERALRGLGRGQARRDLRPDRPQRRRQDHALQRADRASTRPTAASSTSTARA